MPAPRLPPELEQELLEFLADTEDLLKDEWDVDTAAETPVAIEAPGPKKRSGEYVLAEFRKALEDSK